MYSETSLCQLIQLRNNFHKTIHDHTVTLQKCYFAYNLMPYLTASILSNLSAALRIIFVPWLFQFTIHLFSGIKLWLGYIDNSQFL